MYSAQLPIGCSDSLTSLPAQNQQMRPLPASRNWKRRTPAYAARFKACGSRLRLYLKGIRVSRFPHPMGKMPLPRHSFSNCRIAFLVSALQREEMQLWPICANCGTQYDFPAAGAVWAKKQSTKPPEKSLGQILGQMASTGKTAIQGHAPDAIKRRHKTHPYPIRLHIRDRWGAKGQGFKSPRSDHCKHCIAVQFWKSSPEALFRL